jgi:hypothetical protein
LIYLPGIQIGGPLDFSGATLTAKDVALVLEIADIAGEMLLKDHFSSSGEIVLLGTHIGGDLNCSSASFTCKDVALLADDARIAGTVYLTEKFSSAGTLRFLNTQIDGNLDCRGAKLTAIQNTLYADQAKINQNVYLSEGFSSSSAVRFRGAKIGGDLDCSRAAISDLECIGTQTSGDLIWKGIQQPGDALVYLTNSTFSRLLDDRASWPAKGRLVLDGFVYRDLVLSEEATEELLVDYRIDWLERQPKTDLIKPQPWLQVAKILEARGDPDGAKRVVFKLRRQQVLAANPLWQGATFVYDTLEEQPFWILFPIALLWFFGFVIFWRAARMSAMCPRDKDAYNELLRFRRLPGQYPRFNPAVYALENVLPVVKLGQDDAWGPSPQAKPGSWFSNRKLAWTRWLPGINYPWLTVFRWTLILLGWVLAGILAAAIGERFKI